MHRHGYKGRKLGRERDARRALMKTLASNLIDNESIQTTLPKAKEIRPYVERLITKAKVGTLHTRRQVISKLSNQDVANKLVDELAPLLASRNSGYLRIVKEGHRRGDNAPVATVEFVDDLDSLRSGTIEKATNPVAKTAQPKTKKPAKAKTATKDKE